MSSYDAGCRKVSAFEPIKSPKTSWNLTPQHTANNKLQGLAFAATGFALQMAWLSRVALLMPLLLAAAQQMQPDSPESLAQRLWEAGVTCKCGSLSMLHRIQELAKSVKSVVSRIHTVMDKYKEWTRCCCMVDIASSNFVAGFD